MEADRAISAKATIKIHNEFSKMFAGTGFYRVSSHSK